MTNKQKRAAIILAAGHGTRMKSSLSKVLHKVAGRAMLDWVIALARDLDCEKIVVVTGAHNQDATKKVIAQLGEGAHALQDPSMGTGHAVNCAKAAMGGFDGNAIVLYADTPLITKETALKAFEAVEAGASVAVLGFEAKYAGAYGRLVENNKGDLLEIVEAKEASPEILAINLCNSGVMAAPAKDLFTHLENVTNENAKGEYYLTDVVGLAVATGQKCVAVRGTEDEVMGVNSRLELAEAESAFQSKIRREMMVKGVTLIAPDTVFFSYDTQIENDVIIEPNVVFGEGVTIKSGAHIKAFTHIEGGKIDKGAIIGPYSRIRPGSEIGEDCHIGNFVETKNAKLSKGVKSNHLTYLGDVTIGEKTNIGAGTITCNYDGYFKYKTEIGAGVLIGSDTMLVAPIIVGDNAMTGSSSTITKDIPSGALAVGRAAQKNLEGWADKFHKESLAKKANK
jgi:bifunctional UDP-N-acetylglucosamine pyrophosphorylase / glucosamine-1-phosphate N-acetyltransferase